MELSPDPVEIGLDFRLTSRVRPAAKTSAISERCPSKLEEVAPREIGSFAR
jgi:hypothetical protein